MPLPVMYSPITALPKPSMAMRLTKTSFSGVQPSSKPARGNLRCCLGTPWLLATCGGGGQRGGTECLVRLGQQSSTDAFQAGHAIHT